MAQIASKNLTIGKGQVFLAKHTVAEPTAPAQGYRDAGNAPGVSINITTETLPHFSSRGGLRQKDLDPIIEVTRTGTLTLDDMDPKNLALFFLGEELTVSASSETGTVEVITNVEKGLGYQLGVSGANPSGDRKITNVSVETVTGATALVVDVDYEVDADRGFITLLPGGTVVTDVNKGAGIEVTYDVAATTRTQVIAGDTEFRGSMQFHAYNPVGPRTDYFFPLVSLRPNGDLALISEEYMQVEFQFEVLVMGDLAAAYMNGQPV